MTQFVIEIMKELNESPEKIAKHLTNAALRTCFYYAFDTRNKFILPEGVPEFKRDAAPLGMSPSNFQMETQRFYIFCRGDMQAIRREALFIQLLEGLHPSEADLLIAIKDQTLNDMFPNITREVYVQICPDIPEEVAVVKKPKSEEKPRGKGRPPGAKNKAKDDEVESMNDAQN